MNMEFERKLAIPTEVKRMYPITAKVSTVVEKRARKIAEIFEGKSNELVLIIGPCSADNEDSVIDYISRLSKVQEKVAEKVFIIPRIYTNKPRTTGFGYKGLLHQPNPDEKPDMFKGIIATRELHMRAVLETGFSCADEMLYPENHKYLDDLLAYVAVGARSVEDQQHRLTASGIEVPVGMKNPTSGDFNVMMNAILTAQNPHTFIYRGWEAHSKGNPYAHAILRGHTSKHGRSIPNYHYEDILLLCDFYDEYVEKYDIRFPSLIIDTNHCNSDKNPFEQPRIIKEVISSSKNHERIRKILKGFMVESYIVDGRQDIGGGTYGQSITDPCLGWEKTEQLIYEIADMW